MKFGFEKNFEERQSSNIYNSELEMKDYFDKFKYESGAITLEDMKKYINLFETDYPNPEEKISQAQMLEDFDQFKFLVKNVYVAYKLFGEEVFNEVFAKLEYFINTHKTAKIDEFADAICLSLANIKDMHLSIRCERNKFKKPATIGGVIKTYFNKDIEIVKNGQDFYFDGKKIKSINGDKNLENYIKLVCDVNGNLKYTFIIRENNKLAIEKKVGVTCQFEDENERKFVLNQKETQNIETKEIGSVKKIGKCLYIQNLSCMYHSLEVREKQNRIIEQIEQNIDDVDFVIIDSRGNTGGSDNVPKHIMSSILGLKDFESKIGHLDLAVRYEFLKSDNQINSNEQFIEWYWENYQSTIKNGKPNVSKMYTREQQSFTQSRHKRVFILTDSVNASAGECYNGRFSSFPEVVFLNDYTRGCTHLGNVRSFILNKSKIRANLQVSFFMYGSEMVEGKGFPPDIYFVCEKDEILQTTKNFIEKNTEFRISPSTIFEK